MGESKEQIINFIKEQDYGKVIYLFEEVNEATIQDVIQSISENEILAIFGGCSDNAKEKIINSVDNNDFKENLIGRLRAIRQYEYIKNNKNELREEFIYNIIKELLNTSLDDLRKKILFEDRLIPNISGLELHRLLGKEFVKENIEDIVKLEFDENTINQKLELIKKIEECVGNNIYLYMDFRILDDKYIKAIRIDGILNIALNNEKQSQLLGLDETRLKILYECLNNNPVRNELDTYKTLIETILSNLSNDSFSDLINSIDDINNLTKTDIKAFQKVLQKDNKFEIRSLEDLRNYEELKKRKCDEWIKSEDIEKKRLAVFEKIFGQDIEFLNRLQMRFSNIEEIKNDNIRKFLKCIREILQIDNPKVLEEFYNYCTRGLEINDILIEQEIQKEYGDLFNEGLLKIEQCEKIGDNMYEAGTDFKMIVHRRDKGCDNYFADWNQEKSLSYRNDYFCGSYIRSDMIAVFGERGGVLYGFNELDSQTICGCCAGDGGTMGAMQNLTTPNNLINSVQIHHTGENENCYNELNYKRFNNNQRQQPNYLVVFRINGEIDKNVLNEAEKAQKQWNNELPIVVIDVNKCIEAERQKVEDMIKKYEQTKSPILAREIYYKIRNNQATIAHHKGKIKTTFFEEEMEQYIVSDEEIEKYRLEHKQEKTNTNRTKSKIDIIYDELANLEGSIKSTVNGQAEEIEQTKDNFEITPTDIAKLDQDRKITTTEVMRNILIRIINRLKEKFKQGKIKDGR